MKKIFKEQKHPYGPDRLRSKSLRHRRQISLQMTLCTVSLAAILLFSCVCAAGVFTQLLLTPEQKVHTHTHTLNCTSCAEPYVTCRRLWIENYQSNQVKSLR